MKPKSKMKKFNEENDAVSEMNKTNTSHLNKSQRHQTVLSHKNGDEIHSPWVRNNKTNSDTSQLDKVPIIEKTVSSNRHGASFRGANEPFNSP